MKRFVLALSIGLIFVVTPGFATILTFDNMGIPNGAPVINYGSNMTGPCTGSGQPGCVLPGNGFTPYIAVTYRTLNALGNGTPVAPNTSFWGSGYGDLTNVTYPAVNGDYAEVTLTPQNGRLVKLNSFDLAGYLADISNQTVQVFNADYSVVLFSFNGTIHGAPPTHDSFNGLNLVSSSALHIQFGPSFNIAIDDINFDQQDPVLTRYFSNLDKGDSTINMTNTGISGGNICVNVYTFAPDEQLISCCACPITPDGLASLSVHDDLISNVLTPAVPTSVTVKLIPTAQPALGCNAALSLPLAPGLGAWATTLHGNPTIPPTFGNPTSFSVTETEFSNYSDPTGADAADDENLCFFIGRLGSGFGICKSCRLGGLGADRQ